MGNEPYCGVEKDVVGVGDGIEIKNLALGYGVIKVL